MRNTSPFQAKLAASPLPVRYLSFYVRIMLPFFFALYALYIAVIAALNAYPLFEFAFIFYPLNMALCAFVFLELKCFSYRGFLLNQIAVCLFGAYAILYLVGMVEDGLLNALVIGGIFLFLVWVFPNLYYFGKRKSLFKTVPVVLPRLKAGKNKTSHKEFKENLQKHSASAQWLRFTVRYRLPFSIACLAIVLLGILAFSALTIIDSEFSPFHGLLLSVCIPYGALLALLCLTYRNLKNLSPKGYKLAIILTIAEPILNLIAVLINPAFYAQVLFAGSLALFVINLPYLEKRRHLFVYSPDINPQPSLPNVANNNKSRKL